MTFARPVSYSAFNGMGSSNSAIDAPNQPYKLRGFTGFFSHPTMYRKRDTPKNQQSQSSSQQAKNYSFSKSSNNRFICL
jgi:hypothetical protein